MARKEELETFKQFGVYLKVPLQECYDVIGKAPLEGVISHLLSGSTVHLGPYQDTTCKHRKRAAPQDFCRCLSERSSSQALLLAIEKTVESEPRENSNNAKITPGWSTRLGKMRTHLRPKIAEGAKPGCTNGGPKNSKGLDVGRIYGQSFVTWRSVAKRSYSLSNA